MLLRVNSPYTTFLSRIPQMAGLRPLLSASTFDEEDNSGRDQIFGGSHALFFVVTRRFRRHPRLDFGGGQSMLMSRSSAIEAILKEDSLIWDSYHRRINWQIFYKEAS